MHKFQVICTNLEVLQHISDTWKFTLACKNSPAICSGFAIENASKFDFQPRSLRHLGILVL